MNLFVQEPGKFGPESEKESGLEKVKFIWNFPLRSVLSTSGGREGGNPDGHYHQAVKLNFLLHRFCQTSLASLKSGTCSINSKISRAFVRTQPEEKTAEKSKVDSEQVKDTFLLSTSRHLLPSFGISSGVPPKY